MRAHALPPTLIVVQAPLAVAADGVAPGDAALTPSPEFSPIYGIAPSRGYRNRQSVAQATEAAPPDELRTIFGNPDAFDGPCAGALPFPGGAMFVKRAWKQKPSPDFEPATVRGVATAVPVMAKNAKKYPSSGSWGFGRFVDREPADRAQYETCWACHPAHPSAHDLVFTRYAP